MSRTAGVAAIVLCCGTALIYAGTKAPSPQTKPLSQVRHHIATGDTLGELSIRYGTTIAKIREASGLEGETIFVGDSLRITPSREYWASATAKTMRGLAPPANGFDFPVGAGTAKDYYNAQPFGENNHLGDGWNGTGGGNTDLGDPVLAAGAGVVVRATDVGGGWGKVVRVVHNAGTASTPVYIETLYAHLDKIAVKQHRRIERGEQLGTIGTANGTYPAHLHFEIRDQLDAPIGRGYGTKTSGYLDPTAFIRKNRPAESD